MDVFEISVIKEQISAGDVVVDVGAGMGFYTLIIAEKIGPNGRIYAFEPDPKNFNELKKNVAKSGYQNIILENKAVSERSGKIKLFVSEYFKGDHRTYGIPNDQLQSVDVETVSLDDYFKNYSGRMNFIKIDVNGFEASVFRGMKNLLARMKDVKILTEFYPVGLSRCSTDPREYLSFFKANNFTVFHLNDDAGRVELAEENRLLREYTVEKENYTNLLCRSI